MIKPDNSGTLTINGVRRPFQVDSIRQSEYFCAVAEIELDEHDTYLFQLSDTARVYRNVKIGAMFLYSALAAGARMKRPDGTRGTVDFTFDDVLDWAEEAGDDEVQELQKPMQLWLVNFLSRLEAAKKKLEELEQQKLAPKQEPSQPSA